MGSGVTGYMMRCVAMIVAAGLLGSVAGCRGPSSEADAAKALQSMGALMSKDSRGYVKVVNLTTMNDKSRSSEAVKLAGQLVEPGTATFSSIELTPEDIATIAKMTTLNELNLTDTNIDDAGIAKLSRLKRLGTLYLTGTDVSDASFETIGKFSELKVLGLGRTKVSKSFAPLASLKKLNWIVISDMTLSDEQLESLSQLPALQTVTLGNAKYNSAIVDKLREANDKLLFDTAGANSPLPTEDEAVE